MATTYWLADPEGVRAPVEAADKDRLIRLHGWTESAEPDRLDFVWIRNEDPVLGAARMTWEAAQLDAWAGRGWSPSLPPSLVAEPEPPVKTPAKTSASSGDKKE